MEQRILKILHAFERVILLILILLMIGVVLISTLELCMIILRDVFTPPVPWLEITQLLEIFGFFLLIVIGVELLETLKAYLREEVVHMEIVLEVALIAIARKVIILDIQKYEPLAILGIAALILSIAIAFWLVKEQMRRKE